MILYFITFIVIALQKEVIIDAPPNNIWNPNDENTKDKDIINYAWCKVNQMYDNTNLFTTVGEAHEY